MLIKAKWYVTNPGHKVVAGPFDTEDEAQAAATERGRGESVHQAIDDKVLADGYNVTDD